MEKSSTAVLPVVQPAVFAPPRSPLGRTLKWVVLAAVCFVYIRAWGLESFYKLTIGEPTFTSQNGIVWRPCGENIECGRLEVPLDYHDLSAGSASLSLARYPATNKTGRIGTLLTNPGGPGGSGVSYIYRAAQRISEILEGKYDIVSWDPRGINGTLPRVECFSSETEQELAFANTHQDILPDFRNLSDPIDFEAWRAGMRLADARNAVVAQLCLEKSGDTLKHVGTATVVRDLDTLYRALEGNDTLINFWGFSYGTVVGSYLANMFPERVGRVAIDGIVDPDVWANKPAQAWPKWDLVDSEKALDHFYTACAEAGPGRCALASKGSTARSISTAVDKFLADLYEEPIPAPKASRPTVLTASSVQAVMFTYMYRPREWSVLADILSSAIKGDPNPLVNLIISPIELDTSKAPRTVMAIYAVTCVDTPSFDGISTQDAFSTMVKELAVSNEISSEHFSALQVDLCHHWKVREVERFTGPFNSTTKNEILVISNTRDPITPLPNGLAVNKAMPHSSRLIIQDGSGHCSSAMASLCTTKAIREYFVNGKLPPNGLRCDTNEKLFPPKDSANSELWLNTMEDGLSEADEKLLESARELGLVMDTLHGSRGIRGY